MSTLNSFFCRLPSTKKCKQKRSQTSKRSSNCTKNTRIFNTENDNNNNNNQKQTSDLEDRRKNKEAFQQKFIQKQQQQQQQQTKNESSNESDQSEIESVSRQNQPFLSRPMKFLSIHFLYKNPIGRQLTREKLNKSDICRAKNNPELMEDPQQAEYVNSIPNALCWRGLLLQGYLVSAKALRQIESFRIRDDDIWLATYPKSGTTWTEEILSLIVADANVKKTNKTLLPERVPHLEVGPPIGYMKWLKNRPSPRMIATHLPVDHIPQQLRNGKAKIIYVVRNPKDNAVSYYHHHRMSTFLGNYNGTWNNFVHLFAKGQLVYGDWFEHVRGYWDLARQNKGQVLFISYEELKINLPKMIRIIADFIDHPLTTKKIELIAHQCTFEKMKNNAMVNRENLPVGDLFDMSETKFMRKGIIGDWQNYFTKEENQLFDEAFTDRLKDIGLEIAYNHQEALDIHGDIGTRICLDDDHKVTTESRHDSSGFSESSELSESSLE